MNDFDRKWSGCNGVQVVTYYMPKILQQTGLSKFWVLCGTIIVGVIKNLSILIATFLLDKKGRRPLLLLSTVFVGISMFGLAICFFINKAPALTILMLCVYCVAFSIGWGPIT